MSHRKKIKDELKSDPHTSTLAIIKTITLQNTDRVSLEQGSVEFCMQRRLILVQGTGSAS